MFKNKYLKWKINRYIQEDFLLFTIGLQALKQKSPNIRNNWQTYLSKIDLLFLRNISTEIVIPSAYFLSHLGGL